MVPLLSAGGLTELTERGTDAFFDVNLSTQLSPSSAHNYLKKYLHPDYRFNRTLDVYSFLRVIIHASKNNEDWVRDLALLPTMLLTPAVHSYPRMDKYVVDYATCSRADNEHW